MGELKKWREQNWVRIGTDGKIKGPCGTSKNKKNPDRCLPMAKARSLSQSQRAATAKKKKRAGAKGKTICSKYPKSKGKKWQEKEIRQFQGLLVKVATIVLLSKVLV